MWGGEVEWLERVQCERHCSGRVSFEQRCFITSLGDVNWRLGVTFREDGSRIRRGNAPHNIGVIRHRAMNLLRREKTKISYRKKRLRVALNDIFRYKILIM